MKPLHPCLLACLFAFASVACRPTGTEAPAEVPSASPQADDSIGAPPDIAAAVSPTQAPTPPVVEGAETTYLCGGGELRVHYSGGQAHVLLADGREATLLLDQQAMSAAGGEVFTGEGLTLRRSANTIQLQQGGQGPQVCSEASSTA